MYFSLSTDFRQLKAKRGGEITSERKTAQVGVGLRSSCAFNNKDPVL